MYGKICKSRHIIEYSKFDIDNINKFLIAIDKEFYQINQNISFKEVLDLDKKTILHIPNVNSMESTGQKLHEVDTILDAIGSVVAEGFPDRHHDGENTQGENPACCRPRNR